MKRNLEIDRLRAIGVLLLIFYHLALINHPGIFIPTQFTTVVDLFFVISGFVISSVLVKQTIETRDNKPHLVALIKSFYVRRIFRIYPSLWTVYFLVLFLSVMFIGGDWFSPPSNVIKISIQLLTSTYNFFNVSWPFSMALGPFWTLTIEEQFYLFYPLMLILLPTNRQRVIAIVSMILLITFVFRPLTIYHYYANTILDYGSIYFTQSRFDTLMYGSLIYIISLQPWFQNLRPKTIGKSWLRMLFVAVALYACIGISFLGYSPAVYLPINCLLVSSLLVAAAFDCGIVSFPKIIQAPLDFFAPRSYSLYVIHVPMILLVNASIAEGWFHFNIHRLITPLSIIMILIGNELLYRFVSNPGIKKGREISADILKHADDPSPDMLDTSQVKPT